jgi:mono/diheme cytochrome c family protein
MKRRATALLTLCAPVLCVAAVALLPGSAASEPALDETQLVGLRLFNQSCRVCHTKPQLTSPQYGPVLSKDSAGGREDVMRQVISDGTPRMPGFKHHFAPAQIDAIVAYLKTVPAPAP